MTVKKYCKKVMSGILAVSLAFTSFLAADRAKVSAQAAEQKVSVKCSDKIYYYSEYGFGTGFTRKYTVTFGDVSGTAYCVQPSKYPPDSGEYSVTKLSDGKALAKVCYYGTKVSGDDSFFASDPDYGELSEGARLILVHLAASYANGSDDAFSGANDRAQKLAKKLYQYCMDQPAIPDVEMSFSDDTPDAYLDGDSQRTKTITFKADEQQTITLKLPDGVCLHNVTSGKTSAAGANVEISGGTKFYLTAPLTQAKDVSGSWSAKMKGSITKDFSAYKISTGSTQDLALVFGEGVPAESYVDLRVNWLKTADIALVKTDTVTKNGIAGAVYGIYRDAACTDLIQQMPATDAKGASKAMIIREADTVYVREISVPAGYVLDRTVYPVKLKSGDAVNVSVNVSEKETLGAICVRKVDTETKVFAGQGDAKLTGAVYGLYAQDDIVHPDKKTGTLYRAGELVAKKTFGADGLITFSGLHLGNYYVQEITPPEGYLRDEKRYEIALSYSGSDTPVVQKDITVEETVMRQAFQLIKVSTDGSGGELPRVEGAEFTVKLKSETDKNGWEGAQVYDTLTTDADGIAQSKELPYGLYLVRETKTPDRMNTIPDFTVRVDSDSRKPQTWRVFNDMPGQAYLRIVKKDARTGRTVLLPGVSFKIRNTDTGEYVSQRVGLKKIDTFVTGEDGTVTTPLMVKAGNYELEEFQAPEGYTILTERLPITITGSGAIQGEVDEDGNPVIEVDMKNEPVTGELHIYKHGERLDASSGTDEPAGEQTPQSAETVETAGQAAEQTTGQAAAQTPAFAYRDVPLSGVVFEIAAAEDIYTPDHQVDEHGNRILESYQNVELKKGAVAATVTTDREGKASLAGLPLGTYVLREINATDGFAVSDDQTFTLAYEDQDTAIVSYESDVANKRVKAAVSLVKTSAVSKEAVQGAVYGLYAAEDISDAAGNVAAAKDALIEQGETDAEGRLEFGSDLPLGIYYVKEISAPAGYLLDETAYPVDLHYQGQEKELVSVELKVTDTPAPVENVIKKTPAPKIEKENSAPEIKKEAPAPEVTKVSKVPKTGSAGYGGWWLLLSAAAAVFCTWIGRRRFFRK